MDIQVETETSGSHTLAVEWVWENAEGFELVGLLSDGQPPPKLRIIVTQLDPCEAT